MAKAHGRRNCEMRCKRRGPVDSNCPSMVVGIARDCREAERRAIHSVPAICWHGGATYGHCKPVRIHARRD